MWRAPLVALLWLAGCGHNIGDSCKSNVDCSPLGDRFCDISALNGYCTIENCGAGSCPGDSVCIRFFTPVDAEPCTVGPSQELTQSTCAHVDDRCVCDQTDSSGNCMGSATGNNGHCAPSSTERRWCQHSCSSNSDCRTGYECRSTGSFGAQSVPTFDMGAGQVNKFCAPTGSTT